MNDLFPALVTLMMFGAVPVCMLIGLSIAVFADALTRTNSPAEALRVTAGFAKRFI